MKKAKLLLGLVLGLGLFLGAPQQVFALGACDITMSGVSLTPGKRPDVSPTSINKNTFYYPIKICVTDPLTIQALNQCVYLPDGNDVKWEFFGVNRLNMTQVGTNCFETTMAIDSIITPGSFTVRSRGGACATFDVCPTVNANLNKDSDPPPPECAEARENFENCESLNISPTDIVANEPVDISFYIDPLLKDSKTCFSPRNLYTNYRMAINPPKGSSLYSINLTTGDNAISYTPKYKTAVGSSDVYKITIQATGSTGGLTCEAEFTVGDEDNPGSMGSGFSAAANDIDPFKICNQIPDGDAKADCQTCYDSGGVWTSVGCINRTSAEDIVATFMKIGLSIAGGVALLMILASAFMFSTSEGEPKRTSEAKEMLTYALIGLLFIIFSVTLLQFIGVSIFRLPEFGI